MACYSPLTAYKSYTKRTESGKALVEFRRANTSPSTHEEIELKCGQCIGCRIDQKAQWALRSLQEASLHLNNSFVTFTYNDGNLPEGGALHKPDMQAFWKRLRKAIYPQKIRTLYCGEYGGETFRPHYHALVFGYNFPDKKIHRNPGPHAGYTSDLLKDLWPMGYTEVGEFNWESAQYCVGYVTKKMNGPLAEEKLARVDPDTGETWQVPNEFMHMSNRPGIGRKWIEKYIGDCYPKDFVTQNGRRFKVPKYYDAELEKQNREMFEQVKAKRQAEGRKTKGTEERTLRRLNVKRQCAQARDKRNVRGL